MKKFLSYLLMLILVASCLSIPAAANAEDWITLRVECFDRSVSGLSVESNLQHDYIQKNFGDPNHIKVELVPVSRWSETDILNTWLAGGTAPDICYTYDTALVQQYVNMGGLTPLNDLLAEYGPNVSEFLGRQYWNMVSLTRTALRCSIIFLPAASMWPSWVCSSARTG